MATRWMKWNEGTHIFEYSTDGVVFSPLPLDASILTQGLIDPARLPAGLPGGGSNNVWTGTNLFSGVAPALRFNETDQAVDAKNWDIGVDAGIFRLRSLTDAFASISELVKVNRSGQVTIAPNVPGAALDIQGSLNSQLLFSLRNTNAGTNRITRIQIGNDASAQVGVIDAMSSGFASSYWNQANGIAIEATQTGGLNLAASHGSGSVRLFTGGVAIPRLHIASNGDAYFTGNLYEMGRTFPHGNWTNVPYVAGDFTASSGTWTVELADVSVFNYSLVGRTCFFNLRLLNTSTSAGMGTQLKVKVPGGLSAAITVGTVHYHMNGVFEVGLFTCQGGDIILFRQNFNAAHTSGLVNTFDIRCQGWFNFL